MLQEIGQSSELIPAGTTNDKSDIRYHLLYETTYHCIYSIIVGGRRYVLKGIRPTVQDKARQECLLQREYTILTQLESPFIVRVWELRKDPKVGFCIVMEYIDGQLLDSWLRSKPSLRQKHQILNEILDTIQYLHSKQIIHGDLKPGNILITNGGNHIKLLDLGLADKDEFAQTNLGCTKRYAAPEQIKGENIDGRTDIFALGAIIRLLFPHQYLCIVHKCTRSRKERRYSSIASLHRAITLRSVLSKLIGILIAISLLFLVFYRYTQSRFSADTYSASIQQDSIRESIVVVRDTVVQIIHQPLAVPTEERRMQQDSIGDSSVVTRDMVAQIVQQQLTVSPEERRRRQAASDSAEAVFWNNWERKQALREKKRRENSAIGDTINARQKRLYYRYKQLYRDYTYPHYVEFTDLIWEFYEADFRKMVGECLNGKDYDVSITLKIQYENLLRDRETKFGLLGPDRASIYDSRLYETNKEQIDAQLAHLKDSLAAYKAEVDSFFSVEDLQKQIQKR